MSCLSQTAAIADLFDQGENSQPGERQASLEEYWAGSISQSVAAKAEEARFAAKDQGWWDAWNTNKGAAQKSFTLSSDPSHGWLLVTRDDMRAVGLTEADISPYSYQSGGWIALEEDCDAGTFIEAYHAKFGVCPEIKSDEKGARIRAWKDYGTKKSNW